jgi:hypothetical protein
MSACCQLPKATSSTRTSGPSAGETVFGVGGNPDFVAGVRVQDLLAYLHLAAVVEHDPQFGAAGVRLEAEAHGLRPRSSG